jgi:hypothetical protein
MLRSHLDRGAHFLGDPPPPEPTNLPATTPNGSEAPAQELTRTSGFPLTSAQILSILLAAAITYFLVRGVRRRRS